MAVPVQRLVGAVVLTGIAISPSAMKKTGVSMVAHKCWILVYY